MDPLVHQYLHDVFPDDFRDVLVRSFELLIVFEYPDLDQDFVRLLMAADSQHPDAVRDAFLASLNDKLDEALAEHTLVLTPECPFYQKNEVLSALYAVQALNDYSTLYYLLESPLTDDDKLHEFIAQHSVLTPGDCDCLITEYDPALIHTLKAYIEQKTSFLEERTQSAHPLQKKVLENLKQYVACVPRVMLAAQLVSDGIALAEPFDYYIDQLGQSVIAEQNAEQLLALLLLSSDGFLNPLVCYRKHSAQLWASSRKWTEMDAALTAQIGAFESYKTAHASRTPEPARDSS